MTGFGSATLEDGPRRVSVEARSVNHRYLKVAVRLPRAIQALEPDVEAAVQKTVRRGAVAVTVSWRDAAARRDVALDLEAAAAYRRQVEKLWETLGLKPGAWHDPVTPLLGLPGVVRSDRDETGEPEIDADSQRLLSRALDGALAALLRSREQEGEALALVMAGHAQIIEQHLGEIAARAPSVPTEQRDRLVARARGLLKDLDPKLPVSEPDLLRELCLLADRADVTEELNRLRSHLTRFRKVLAEGGEVGRRLDFLLQEMLRESNTVGSKANDAGIAHAVVELKCEIERMKEQVQNLE